MEKQSHSDPPAPRKTKTTMRAYAALAVVVLIILVVAISKVAFHHNGTTANAKASPVAVVRITNKGFEPATLSVKQGTRVVWTNADTDLHQVAANPYPKGGSLPSLKSEILNNAQTYTYKADKTGSFGYHDQLAPTINGTLIVQKR